MDYFCKVEKIGIHIEKLLAKHDYVVVPNLGGFVVQTESAVILQQSIIAPQAIIGFNPLMQHVDGLLAIEIAKSESISYRQSIELIDNVVKTIKTELKSSKQVQIGELGYLRLNSDNNLIFTASSKPSFLPQNIGLTDIFIQQKTKKTSKQKTISFTLPSRIAFKYAASAIIIIALLFVSPTIVDKRLNEKADLSSLLEVKSLPNKTKIDSTTISTPVALNAAIIQNDSTAKTANVQKFHVIVASSSTQKCADDFCNELIESNFKNAHILTPTNIFRVAIQSFDDKEKAIEYMEELRSTDSRFETAWVYCQD